MARNRQYNPANYDNLESRQVLSHAHVAHPAAALLSTLNPAQYALNTAQQSLIAQINQAFDLFKSDYGQARATYFSSILNQPSPSMATTNAFIFYTTQRVELLGQQLISTFLEAPDAANRPLKLPNPIQQLISTKIIGTQGKAPEGSLAKSLYENVPAPGTSQPTESLYTLSQDIAIETARISMINGVSILKSGYFGYNASSRKH